VKLQLLAPGETASPGSAIFGKTGRAHGTNGRGLAIAFTVNAVDAELEPGERHHRQQINITSTDPRMIYCRRTQLWFAGTKPFSLTTKTAGSWNRELSTDVYGWRQGPHTRVLRSQ
jgi:hypothetical protein